MKKKIDVTALPTQEQLLMLAQAEERALPPDAEYPEFSQDELRQFKKAASSSVSTGISFEKARK